MARHLIGAGILVLAALALTLPGIDTHGFWFDEAYTARLAALDWGRLLRGAQQDIHPPGWPLLAGVFASLPLDTEVALRLPSVIAFAMLVGVVSRRVVPAGICLLLYGPLVEQATQARPYVLLALALVAVAGFWQRREWALAGLAAGLAGSFQALGGALAAAAIAGAAVHQRPSKPDFARFLLPVVVLTGWWLPAFIRSASGYLSEPWYHRSSLADAWVVSEAGAAVVGAGLLVALQPRDERWRFLPAAAVALLLLGLQVAGVGVEIRKTGLVLLPLLLAGTSASPRGVAGGALCALCLAVSSVSSPARPDLREARDAVAEVPGVPVVSVFASESAWYLREPAPLPSYREPERIAARLGEVVEAYPIQCVVSIALPGTAPTEEQLPHGLRTLYEARVTGLDVRLVGTSGCRTVPAGPTWSRVGEAR